MSKDRAKRRAAREHEAALRTAARAAEYERRERRRARGRALRKLAPTGLLRPSGSGRQTGILARRAQARTILLITVLLAVQVVVWVLRPDWAARLAALVLSILVAPVLAMFLLRRT